MLTIAPSLLAADFAKLAEEIKDVEQGGADWLHVDVMDGHFVPNITFGPFIVKAMRSATTLPLDVHLMITDPERYIKDFVSAGADIITVHAEACRHLHSTVQQIRNLGVKAGIALNPATPLSMVEHVLEDIDMVLIMTVNPGFGGQSFIHSMQDKIQTLRHTLTERGLGHIDIEVDGGINAETAPLAIAAGANILVAGSAVFNSEDRANAIRKLRTETRHI